MPKRRRDFERNREVILNAADATFTEIGMAASIATVAKRAGVAPATVYRHFPSRLDLVNAVFDLRVKAYCAVIEDAQLHDDPRTAFRQTIQAIVNLQAHDRSFREILTSRETDPQLDSDIVRFGTALLSAITDARETGVIRDDVADADIMVLLTATEGIARPAGLHSPEALKRIVDLILDGLCHDRTPLEGAPLDLDQVLAVARG